MIDTATSPIPTHVCGPTSCESDGHDRTCVALNCAREISDDQSDTCDDHEGEGDDRRR